MDEEPSDYYVKLGVSGEVSTELSNISYNVRELRRLKNSLDNTRQKKALMRKEFYELLINLRLDLDKLKNSLPTHEANKLIKQIEEIDKYQNKPVKKVIPKNKEEKKPVKKSPALKKKEEPEKKTMPKKEDNMMSSEKRELELLRQDLESISQELKNRK